MLSALLIQYSTMKRLQVQQQQSKLVQESHQPERYMGNLRRKRDKTYTRILMVFKHMHNLIKNMIFCQFLKGGIVKIENGFYRARKRGYYF